MQEVEELKSISLFSFDAIGTHWEIETYEPLSNMVQHQVLQRIETFDRTYSRFRYDSLVTQIANETGGVYHFPDDAVALFDFYDKLYYLSDGAVDPLIGHCLEQMGYDKTYSLRPQPDYMQLVCADSKLFDWTKDVERDGNTVITQRALVIDIGAAGKGYLVDLVSKILLTAGIRQFVIDAGGDIFHTGVFHVSIGLEHPLESKMVIGEVSIKDASICASASNRRAWGGRLHHIIDARTGIPASNVIATWAIANDALTADGLATVLFFADADTLMKYFSFSYVRMFSDRTVEVSKNFKGEIFF
jgi:thiamine biosynthesis lipoprotein